MGHLGETEPNSGDIGPLERERALREITAALASDLDEQRVLQLAIKQASYLMGAPCARVWLLDEAKQRLHCVSSTNSLHPRLQSDGLPIDSLTGQVAVRGLKTLNLPDATLSPGWQDPGFKARTGLGAYLTAAITRAGESLGVLQVIREVGRPFGNDDEELLTGLADALAIAVSNARLYRHVRDQLAERQRTELALRQKEDTYRQMFEGNQAIKLLIDPSSGQIIEANKAACEYYGYAYEELLQLSIKDINQLAPGEVQAEMDNAARQHRTYFLFRHRMADGRVRDVEVHSSPVDVGGRSLLYSIIHDITERREAEAALQYQAWHDQLTGLRNRAFLRSELERRTSLAADDHQQFGILLIDLDHFKDVNDTLGHPSGDRLLQQVARRFTSNTGEADVVARMGGDEFVLLIPKTSPYRVRGVADRLVQLLQQPFELEGSQLEIGASIGIAFYPQHGSDPDTLLRRADVAMYAAKNSGRGWALYDPAADSQRPDRLRLAAELRRAIDHDELLLHYQPQIDIQSGRMVALEALVRWAHPTRGLVSPDQFVPLAEQMRMTKPLTHWVLGEALRQCASWRATGWEMPVAVNLSALDLQDFGLPDYVADCLQAKGVPAKLLRVEVTESSLMADPPRARSILEALRSQGVQIAIDDFGTGYSSLAYLQRLPVDELKIDRMFVQELAEDSGAQGIVRTVIELAQGLGLRVVAEGVEDAATWQALAALGCDLGQGYYFARPLAAANVLEWASTYEGPVSEAAHINVAQSRGRRSAGTNARAAA